MKPKETGDCYRAAGTYLADQEFNPDSDGAPAILVHAIVHGQGPHKGLGIGHAWVEITLTDGYVLCIDRSSNNNHCLPAEKYRQAAKIIEEHRYTYAEMSSHTLKSGHWGPWEGKFNNGELAFAPLDELLVEASEQQ